MFWSIFIQSTAFIAGVVVLGGIVGWFTRGSVRRD
jgi:hypothetical protein